MGCGGSQRKKILFISGGVISGLGKGVVAASLGLLLKDRGFRVACMKADAYLNQDAGTMSPIEHGEVFVTADGLETNQDLGHYERFLGQDLNSLCYLTLGRVFAAILAQERAHVYQGKTVELVGAVTKEVMQSVELCAADQGADFLLVEIGGTVGEYQIQLFLEAARLMAKRHKGRVAHVHVAYVPFPEHLGELKSKPAQLSLRALNECGIDPDFLVLRTGKRHGMDRPRLEKIAQNSNLDRDDLINCPDVDSIYEVPLVFHEQKFVPKLLKKLGMTVLPRPDLKSWRTRVERLQAGFDQVGPGVRIGIVAKYINSGDGTLADSYVSVTEALKHCEAAGGPRVIIDWIDAEEWENDPALFLYQLSYVSGLIIPQGWGSRGAEGKIRAIQFARERAIPYLGLGYGFQLAAVEFARNVLHLQGANSTEVDHRTCHPIIVERCDEREASLRALRSGSHQIRINTMSKLYDLYRGVPTVRERHRHRYQLSKHYASQLMERGLMLGATSQERPGGPWTYEALELTDHPFFIGVQFHPEYQSRFEAPHPLFSGFLAWREASVSW